MKITSNGKFPYEYTPTKAKLLLKGKKYILDEVEVAVPPQFIEVEVPDGDPTRETCERLYPPEPPTPPEPPIPPIPEPPPQPDPNVNWDDNWPNPGDLRDKTRYPLISTVMQSNGGYGLDSILMMDSGLQYPNLVCSYDTGPMAGGGEYPVLKIMPLAVLKQFFAHYYKNVPKGYRDSGPHSPGELAIITHYIIRRWSDFAIADFYDDGFNIAFCWDQDPMVVHTYWYRVSTGQPPTRIFPGLLTKIDCKHPG